MKIPFVRPTQVAGPNITFLTDYHQLFAHASPFATVTDETKQKVADSGLGYMSNWLPQQMILNHRVRCVKVNPFISQA